MVSRPSAPLARGGTGRSARPVPAAGPIAIYVGLGLIWGSSWIAEQALAGKATPLAFGAIRFTLAALLLTALLRVLRPRSAHGRRLSPGEVSSSFVLGLALLALPYALTVSAGVHGAGGWTPLLYAALPLAAAFASAETDAGPAGASRPEMIAAVGAALVILNGALPLGLSRALWAVPTLLAVGLIAFGLADARRRPPTLAGVAVQCGTAAAVLAALSAILESGQRIAPFPAWSLGDGLWLAAIAAPATAVAYPLYYRLLRDLSPAQAASTQWLQFAVAVGESALILARRPSWPMLGGLGVLVFCAARMLFPVSDEPVTIRLTLER